MEDNSININIPEDSSRGSGIQVYALDKDATVTPDEKKKLTFKTGSNSKGYPRLLVYYDYIKSSDSRYYTVKADLYIEAYDFFGSCLAGSWFRIGNSTKKFSGSITSGSYDVLAKRLICTHSANIYGNSVSISAYWYWNGKYSGERVYAVQGSGTVTMPTLSVIPGTPSGSISFGNSSRISYNGYNTYAGLKTDMSSPNTFTVNANVGSNGNKLKVELQYSSNGTSWSTYNVDGFGTTYNGSSKSLTHAIASNDRNYYYRWRVGNGSSTNNWTYGGWNTFRINSLPTLNGTIVETQVDSDSNSDYRDVLFDGATLKMPTISDIEEFTGNCKIRLYYRRKATSSGTWGSWSYLGEYSSGATTKVNIESLISAGEFIQFGAVPRDSLEYNLGSISGLSHTYKRNDKPPTKPVIMSPLDGGKLMDSSIPMISGDNFDYKRFPNIFEITYKVDGGSFLPTDRIQVSMDVDGSKVDSFYYNGRTAITGYSQHTIQAKATNKITGISTLGDIHTFTIYKSNKPKPVILGVEEGKTYVEATPTLKSDPRIGSYRAYLNEEPYKMGTTITTKGSYNIKVIAVSIDTEEEGEAEVNFKVDSLLPDPIEIYGVVEGDVKPEFNIHVIKQDDANMTITLNNNVINPTNSTYNEKSSYNFKVTKNGIYKLVVTASHKTSGQERTKTINQFTVQKGDLSIDLIRFKKATGPVHSAQTILHSGSPNLNVVEYTIDGVKKRYSSPVLIFDNKDVKGRDTNRAKESYDETKRYQGFIKYKPEIPTINGTGDGRIHNEPVRISFTNMASKPTQAMYKIFIDGDELVNPFSNTFTVEEDGYHYVTILGWDNVNPYDYQYKSIRFLLKTQNEKTIRKPYIIAYDNKKDSYVDVKVKFANIDTNFKHSITITEKDGTSKTTNYAYNVNTVNLRIKNNCTLLAKTELVECKKVATATKVINTVFDTVPLNNIRLFGVNKYQFNVGGTPTTYKIGKKCCLEIERRYNEEYEVYINGMPYQIGSIIENRTEEIRKYTVEVVIKNTVKNLESYYSDTFFLDSINPAQPTLVNMTNNLMNRTSLPKTLELKEETNTSAEETILNNRVIDIQTNIINKDDEYILVVTYVYYNGTKRTNSFYFSVNSNPVDELRPNRCILKLLDYKKGDIAKEGELLIDRHTGHIYYKEGTIKPITKNIEDEILEVEKQLIKVESNHETMQSIKFFLDEMISYVKSKQSEFLTRISTLNTKLTKVTTDIDATIKKIDTLESELNAIDSKIQSYITEIKGNRANQIKTLTNNTRKLNNDFITLSNSLKDVFHRASICTEETYKLKDEIATRVTITDFNKFKADENAKYDKFIKTLRDKGVNV